MKTILLFMFLLTLTPVVTAQAGLFGILDKTAYNGSLDIVTDYPDPDKTVQAHKHIRGWIDITGFNNSVRINGTEYSNISTPVIEHDVWDEGLVWNDNLDWIKSSDTRITRDDDNITAEIDIHLLWHHSTLRSRTVCGLNGCRTYTWIQKDYYNEYTTLTTTIQAPQEYPEIKDIPVKITIHNNTINPHVDIHTPVNPHVTKTEFTYKNETITRINLAGAAATGAVNLSGCLYWQDSSDNWSSRHNTAILKYTNESEFDLTSLQVTAHTPYGHRDTSNYSIETVELATTDDIAKTGILTPIALMLLFWFGGKKLLSMWGDMI